VAEHGRALVRFAQRKTDQARNSSQHHRTRAKPFASTLLFTM